jgi:hypothetical protein
MTVAVFVGYCTGSRGRIDLRRFIRSSTAANWVIVRRDMQK